MSMVHFKLDTDADGIALVTWDSPGRSMNVIDLKVIEELAEHHREGRGRRRDQGRGHHLRQGHVLRRRRSHHARNPEPRVRRRRPRAGRGDGRAARLRGEPQAVAALSAAGDLAASRGSRRSTAWRSAAASSCASPAITASPSDNPKSRVGLPEIKIGLFPGAGGTQRVARMMMPGDALQFLLKGDQIRLAQAKGDEARRCGRAGGRSDRDRQEMDQGRRQADQSVGRRRLPAARRAGLFQGRHDDVPAGERDLPPRDLRQLSGRARDHAGGVRGAATADRPGAARRSRAGSRRSCARRKRRR